MNRRTLPKASPILAICFCVLLSFEYVFNFSSVILLPTTSVRRTIPAGDEIRKEEYVSCSMMGFRHVVEANATGIESVQRFKAQPHSWRCRREIAPNNDYFLAWIDFEIHECPPVYAASYFQLVASTNRSRTMGRVGPRTAVRDGCGIYNASVAIMDSNAVSLDLFWTSNYTHYSNRQSDIINAMEIKHEGGKASNVITPERKAFLRSSHLDRIPLFPVEFQVALEDDDETRYLDVALDPADCAATVVQKWTPVGVFDERTSNDTAGNSHWPFRSVRCRFSHRSLAELNEKLAGMRIKFLGDSHGGLLMTQWKELMCPEEDSSNYFDMGYECPHRNNTFQMAHRFFRAIYGNTAFTVDMDGLSLALRRGDPKVCRSVLGLGLYNATIMIVPTWLFVYETQEGLRDFVISVRSMLDNCKAAHPELYSSHIFLLQSASAVDSTFLGEDDNDWRGIHNYRIDAFTTWTQKELGSHVDGIIPSFDLTFARSVTMRTKDSVHWPDETYRELTQVQAAAVMSAMHQRGIEALSGSEESKRWFIGVDLE